MTPDYYKTPEGDLFDQQKEAYGTQIAVAGALVMAQKYLCRLGKKDAPAQEIAKAEKCLARALELTTSGSFYGLPRIFTRMYVDTTNQLKEAKRAYGIEENP